MKIVQMLPTIVAGDAVGNDCLALRRYFARHGIDSQIYAENMGINQPFIKDVKHLKKLKDDDILIYHYAIGSDLNLTLGNYGGRLVVKYHNVTPPQYFENYNMAYYNACFDGISQLALIRKLPELCIADSEYNRQDLIKAGFSCPIEVCPVLIPMDDYKEQPDRMTIQRYEDEKVKNFLFVGRVAPNKRQEDVIKVFAWYKKNISSNCRLFLIGGEDIPEYSKQLRDYVKKLQVEDVFFLGHIKFREILAYYKLADIFLCMSDHEGFCVPIVEAMSFGVPIVAKNTSAIPDTLGKGGIIVNDNNPVYAAKIIERIFDDQKLRNEIKKNQEIELKKYDFDQVAKRLDEILINNLGIKYEK